MDINDIGLQLSAMLSQGNRLTPAVAKMLNRSLGQKEPRVVQVANSPWWIIADEDGEPMTEMMYSSEEEAREDLHNAGKSFSMKGFDIEETGDGGVQVTLDGQVVAGPFHLEEEVQAAIQELQSGMQRGYNPSVKGLINWALLTSGILTGDSIMFGLGLGGTLVDVLAIIAGRKEDDE